MRVADGATSCVETPAGGRSVGVGFTVQGPEGEIVHRSGDIVVTRSAVRFPAASYPVDSIRAVRIEKTRKVRWSIALALLVVFWGVSDMQSADQADIEVGVILAALGLLWGYFAARHWTIYRLVLQTANDEEVFVSKQAAEVQALKTGIERVLAPGATPGAAGAFA
jgi:hypothetical protein